jgi:hypothetical protein
MLLRQDAQVLTDGLMKTHVKSSKEQCVSY